MRLLLLLVMTSFMLVGCAMHGNYHYQSQNDPQQWQGKNITELKAAWGQADQVFHTRTGVSYYVYSANSTANFFSSTTTNFGIAGQSFTRPNASTNMMMQCTTLFKTDQNGLILSVTHKGSNCGGQWVGSTKKAS